MREREKERNGHTGSGNLSSIGESGVVGNKFSIYSSQPTHSKLPTNVQSLLDDNGTIEVDQSRTILVMHNDSVIGSFHNIIRAVSRRSKLELWGNHIAELLLQHVKEQLVERHVRSISQSTELLHVVRENSRLMVSILVGNIYVRLHKMIKPLLSLLGVVEGDQLLLHGIIVRNMVLDELCSLFSELHHKNKIGSIHCNQLRSTNWQSPRTGSGC